MNSKSNPKLELTGQEQTSISREDEGCSLREGGQNIAESWMASMADSRSRREGRRQREESLVASMCCLVPWPTQGRRGEAGRYRVESLVAFWCESPPWQTQAKG